MSITPCQEPEIGKKRGVVAYLKDHVTDEVESETSEVLVPGHAEVVGKPLNLCVADIAAVEEGK